MSNYKFSDYNIFVEYENIVICFNSLSGAIFTIDKANYNLIKNSGNNPRHIKKANDYLYNILKKTRMIINNEINELDIVRFRNRRDVFLDNIYRLGINPTLDCKYLPICFGGCPAVRMGYSEVDMKENTCDKMDSIIIKRLKYRIDKEKIKYEFPKINFD